MNDTADDAPPLLEVERLSKRFALAGRRGAQLHAVDDVSLVVRAGESLGLVGESGCGKSTLVRLLARLIDPSEGRIVFDGVDLAAVPAKRFARLPERARIQMVFQDPTDSLNPRFTAREAIREPCIAARRAEQQRKPTRASTKSATQVGLPLDLLSRFPHQLSGGQKARVGIARALAVSPQAADPRRADRRARRLGAGRRAAAARPPAQGARPRVRVRLARPERRAPADRSRRGDVPRQAGRMRQRVERCSRRRSIRTRRR